MGTTIGHRHANVPFDVRFASMALGVPAAGVDLALLERTRQQMEHAPHARGVLARLREDHVPIRVIASEGAVAGIPEGAAGGYDPARNGIIVRRDQLLSPRAGAALLAHEGQHYIDERAASAQARRLFTTFDVDVLAMPGAIPSDPRDFSIWTETNAYLRQAKVERELGLTPGGFAVDAGGHLRSRAATAAAIAADPLYGGNGG